MDRIDKTRIDFDEEFMEDRRETRIVKYGLNVSPIFRSGPIKFRSILRFQLAVSIWDNPLNDSSINIFSLLDIYLEDITDSELNKQGIST